MKKRERIEAVAAKTGDSKLAAAEAIDAAIAPMTEDVAEGKAVQPVGLVCFAPVYASNARVRSCRLGQTVNLCSRLLHNCRGSTSIRCPTN